MWNEIYRETNAEHVYFDLGESRRLQTALTTRRYLEYTIYTYYFSFSNVL